MPHFYNPTLSSPKQLYNFIFTHTDNIKHGLPAIKTFGRLFMMLSDLGLNPRLQRVHKVISLFLIFRKKVYIVS